MTMQNTWANVKSQRDRTCAVVGCNSNQVNMTVCSPQGVSPETHSLRIGIEPSKEFCFNSEANAFCLIILLRSLFYQNRHTAYGRHQTPDTTRHTLYTIRYTLYSMRYTPYTIRHTLYSNPHTLRYALYAIRPKATPHRPFSIILHLDIGS
jgi:hypothetical protein